MELIYICAVVKHLVFGKLFAGFVHSPLSLFPINHKSLFLTSNFTPPAFLTTSG